MSKQKCKLLKKFAVAGLAAIMTVSTSTLAFASEWHYATERFEDYADFNIRMNYDYSDGSWCDIYLYSVGVSNVAGGYNVEHVNTWHSNASGHSEYSIWCGDVWEADVHIGTSLDEYGQINDYVY